MLFNGWNIISILNNLPHIQTCRLNKKSHSVLLVRVILSIEIYRAINGVSFSNMCDLLCHVLRSFSSTVVRKLNPRGRALMPIEGGSSIRRGVESCLLKTFLNLKTLNKFLKSLDLDYGSVKC